MTGMERILAVAIAVGLVVAVAGWVG